MSGAAWCFVVLMVISAMFSLYAVLDSNQGVASKFVAALIAAAWYTAVIACALAGGLK